MYNLYQNYFFSSTHRFSRSLSFNSTNSDTGIAREMSDIVPIQHTSNSPDSSSDPEEDVEETYQEIVIENPDEIVSSQFKFLLYAIL